MVLAIVIGDFSNYKCYFMTFVHKGPLLSATKLQRQAMDEHFYSAFITLPEFDDIWRSRMSSRIKAYFMNFTSSYLVLQIEFLN